MQRPLVVTAITASLSSLLAILGLAVADVVPHVVVIAIDGLPPSVYTTPGVNVPTLRRLAHDGAFANGVVGIFPTVTYPSHATLLTGVRPAVHGIYNNRILDPEDRSNGGWYWYARDIRTPTLAGAVEARGWTTAAINWPTSVGLDVDVLLPDFTRSDHPESLNLMRSLVKPATLIDDVEADGRGPLQWPLTDHARAEIAASVFRDYQPQLLLLYLFEPDTAQHDYGPESDEARRAFEAADRDVARVLDAIESAGLREQTDVVIVSDHGFLPVAQELQVNAVFKREGLLRVDEKGRVVSWNAYFQPANGAGFVFLRDPDDSRLRQRVTTLLEKLSRDRANGIDRVLAEDELKALGADPRASFAIDMRAGFAAGAAHDTLRVRSIAKGAHGFHPERPELHASLIMAGPHVRRVGGLGIVRMTQIAPTIASWFGVRLSPEADAPLGMERH